MAAMKKAKVQPEIEEKKRRVAVPGSSAVPADKEQQELLKVVTSAWAEEINRFHGETFASVEEATEVLVRRIVDRLSHGVGNEGMSEFLLNFLETDPEVQLVLQRYVK